MGLNRRDFLKLTAAGAAGAAAGAAGAVGMDRAGFEYRQPALVTGPVVDTLGACDVFNAGVISGYLRGNDMPGILRRACTLAGRKCMQQGLTGLTGED